jgi:hypothetical protein
MNASADPALMAAPSRRRDPRALLGFLGWPLILLSAIEFALGMALNLFTSLPSGGAVAILESSPVLILHVIIAFLILGTVARALVLAVRVKARRSLAAASLGMISVIVAILAGLGFTFGDQSPGASYTMSIAFLGVILSAALLLWFRSDPSSSSSQLSGDAAGTTTARRGDA